MKKENQKAILMMLEQDINDTGVSGSKHNVRAHLEEVDENYVLKVQVRLLVKDKIFSCDITPKQVLDWSLNNMGDYFKGYLSWFYAKKTAAEKAEI